MSELHTLKPHPLARRPRKLVGRGPGSGHGKTSGRGHKGQLARGPGARPGFEGGQMPLIRMLPKRGFTFRSRERYQIVNLEGLGAAPAGQRIDREWLYANGRIQSRKRPVKILGTGAVQKGMTVVAEAFSKSAKAKIEKAGGACETAKKA